MSELDDKRTKRDDLSHRLTELGEERADISEKFSEGRLKDFGRLPRVDAEADLVAQQLNKLSAEIEALESETRADAVNERVDRIVGTLANHEAAIVAAWAIVT